METLYFGGPILTMENRGTAQAVLVRSGQIVRVGDLQPLREACPGARMADLKGRTMLPAFLDAHSHLSAAANAFLQAPLAEAVNFDEIADALRRFAGTLPQGAWVIGSGYDQNQLQEKAHPPRALLDEAAPGHPVVIQHKSGHMGVFSTAAMAQLGIGEATPDVPGGRIERENGVPTGYMEEAAFVHWQGKVPMPDLNALMEAYERAQRQYASYGITTVQEGMMPRQLFPIYRKLTAENRLWLDVTAYPPPEDYDAAAEAFAPARTDYAQHLHLGGVKIFLDGSPQGRTAWMRQPYLQGGCGYPTMTDQQVAQAVRFAQSRHIPILAHCNGDAAAAQFLAALRANPGGCTPVMIHAQLLGADQLDEAAQLGVLVSFFAAHVYYWGDTHLKNFGPERARRISPAASALARGVRFTFHQDTPVVAPDMLETVWCAVNRVTRSGVVLEEKIGVWPALEAVTINAAYQYGEQAHKGSIAPGKRADFAILDGNPLATAPMDLRRLRVLATICQDRCIYRR